MGIGICDGLVCLVLVIVAIQVLRDNIVCTSVLYEDIISCLQCTRCKHFNLGLELTDIVEQVVLVEQHGTLILFSLIVCLECID